MTTITRLTLTIQAVKPTAWPHFAGSALRGAFGRALRKAACVTRQPRCDGCAIRPHCAYGSVFDPEAPRQPLHPSFRDGQPRYLFQPPALGACQLAPGQSQSFDLLLLPGSEPHHPLIARVMRTAIEHELCSPQTFRLLHLQPQQLTVGAELPAQWAGTSPLASLAPSHTVLRWQTPLRIQHHGRPVFRPQDLDAGVLVRALLRRQLQWAQLGQSLPAANRPQAPDLADTTALLHAASLCTLDTGAMRWHDIERRSSTQQQKLPLGGLIGKCVLHGPTHALHSLHGLLQMGAQLHVGKEIIMGLGRYQLGDIAPG